MHISIQEAEPTFSSAYYTHNIQEGKQIKAKRKGKGSKKKGRFERIKLSERFVAWLLLNVVRNDLDYTRPGGAYPRGTCAALLIPRFIIQQAETWAGSRPQPFTPFSRVDINPWQHRRRPYTLIAV
jgi:hypothetical protein